eukprot:gene4985-34763_t
MQPHHQLHIPFLHCVIQTRDLATAVARCASEEAASKLPGLYAEGLQSGSFIWSNGNDSITSDMHTLSCLILMQDDGEQVSQEIGLASRTATIAGDAALQTIHELVFQSGERQRTLLDSVCCSSLMQSAAHSSALTWFKDASEQDAVAFAALSADDLLHLLSDDDLQVECEMEVFLFILKWVSSAGNVAERQQHALEHLAGSCVRLQQMGLAELEKLDQTPEVLNCGQATRLVAYMYLSIITQTDGGGVYKAVGYARNKSNPPSPSASSPQARALDTAIAMDVGA